MCAFSSHAQLERDKKNIKACIPCLPVCSFSAASVLSSSYVFIPFSGNMESTIVEGTKNISERSLVKESEKES